MSERFQSEKIATYIKIAELYNRFLVEKDAAEKIKRSDPKFFDKFNVDVGARIFFFASDEVVKSYLEMREAVLGLSGHHTVAGLLSNFFLAIRKELVGADTVSDAKDYLKMITTDWVITPQPESPKTEQD